MKVKYGKNGSIKLTAESKRDSLNLLKFMAGDDPEWAVEIARKEKECEELEANQNKPVKE